MTCLDCDMFTNYVLQKKGGQWKVWAQDSLQRYMSVKMKLTTITLLHHLYIFDFTHLATAATNQSTHKCYIFPLWDATTWFRLRDHLSRFTCWLCLTSKTWFIYFQIYSLQKRSQTMVYHFHVPVGHLHVQ